ncbi:MAG: hypothetical protein HKL91_04680 [Candidatus Eremiobacteraeota bacterium]|uniref:Uncharacterized protein n=1 Tax=mine drainage metagenome TaxID=410659 RepID=E6PE49_9ZZZZ|nr:hypothetical protein [Candidatus Eremiobacteraeota bacterium]
MPFLPPTRVLRDGAPIHSYHPVVLRSGHLYAPAWPVVAEFVDRIIRVGDRLYIYRGGRCVVVRVPRSAHRTLAQLYLPLAATLRPLGDEVRYAAAVRTVDIRTPIAALTPRLPEQPNPLPRVVFAPRVAPTPRPHWSGIPLPRRTPLPALAPSAPPNARAPRDRPSPPP